MKWHFRPYLISIQCYTGNEAVRDTLIKLHSKALPNSASRTTFRSVFKGNQSISACVRLNCTLLKETIFDGISKKKKKKNGFLKMELPVFQQFVLKLTNGVVSSVRNKKFENSTIFCVCVMQEKHKFYTTFSDSKDL